MAKPVLTTKVDPSYDDLPEERYHFPRTYQNAVRQSLHDWIVYYEPRRVSADLSSSGGRQSYFAAARIVGIGDDPRRADHYYAYVEDHLEFDRAVPFREGGFYYESGPQEADGSTDGVGWTGNVRTQGGSQCFLRGSYGSTSGDSPWDSGCDTLDHRLSSVSGVTKPTGGLPAMTDIVDSQKRSEMMSRIRGRDTKPELIVRRIAHRLGFRFRLHRKDLPGCPDIVFPRYRAVIMVHGCFWHRHPDCRYAYTPKTRVRFWQDKLEGNVVRDRRNEMALTELGWRVLVIWECEVNDLTAVEERIAAHLGGPDGHRAEIGTL